MSRSATCEAIVIYQFITNNQGLFHLWWKENLVKHHNSQNIMTMVIYKKKSVSRSHECLWFHIDFILTLYYKTRQMLLQNATTILLQNTSGFFLFKNVAVITKCVGTVRNYFLVFECSSNVRLLFSCFCYTRWIFTPLWIPK